MRTPKLDRGKVERVEDACVRNFAVKYMSLLSTLLVDNGKIMLLGILWWLACVTVLRRRVLVGCMKRMVGNQDWFPAARLCLDMSTLYPYEVDLLRKYTSGYIVLANQS